MDLVPLILFGSETCHSADIHCPELHETNILSPFPLRTAHNSLSCSSLLPELVFWPLTNSSHGNSTFRGNQVIYLSMYHSGLQSFKVFPSALSWGCQIKYGISATWSVEVFYYCSTWMRYFIIKVIHVYLKFQSAYLLVKYLYLTTLLNLSP